MVTIYRMKEDMTTPEGRRRAYEDLGVLFAHLEAFNVTPKQVQFFAEGIIKLTIVGTIPKDQLEHVGLDPASETKLE